MSARLISQIWAKPIGIDRCIQPVGQDRLLGIELVLPKLNRPAVILSRTCCWQRNNGEHRQAERMGKSCELGNDRLFEINRYGDCSNQPASA